MDVFDLVAKIRLDSSEYESGVGKARGTFSNLASGVKTGLATVAKVGAAAVAAGVAGVTALTKMGVEGYAQYEQLAGGVETLFKGSSNAVMKYAENAYKTSGLSSNAYLETVTSFSASLIQSLGGDTAKAAQVADAAITDMSDNANKMGTNIGMIQNAYQGFAKGNFTMLDNLKLGYGGTKEEMQRLLDHAETLPGAMGRKFDLSNYADVVEAIHLVQDEMGIAGATAAEAATTIEGSLAMMKAAWQNLVVGMADSNADMDVLINNFVESTATAAKNLLPRIEQTLKGIGQLIEKMAPIIADAIPKVVEALLPTIITAAISLITALVNGIVTALPAVKTALEEGLVIILTDVFGVSEDKARGFVDKLNSAFTAIADGFRAMVDSAQTDGTFLNDVWTGLQDTGKAFVDFCVALWDSLSAAFTWCVEQINTEGTFLNAIWVGIQTFITAAINIIQNAIKMFTAILRGDWSSAWEAVENITETVANAIGTIIANILQWIFSGVSDFAAKLKEKWDSTWSSIKTATSNFLNAVKSAISEGLNNAKNTVTNILNSIKSHFSNIWNNVKSTVSNALSNVKSSISSGLNSAKSTVSSVLDGIKSKFKSIWDNCTSIVKNAVTALKNALNFHWELPKLKLPHFTISGKFSLNPPSVPHFGIEWYKKAYDNAMILSNPTIFGYSAASGKFLGGGDGNGNEIVAGESYLMNLIGNAVAERNGQIVELLSALLAATVDGNDEMVRALKSGQVIALNERELGRVVRSLA